MSSIKQYMDEMEWKRDVATNIAIEAGALERCDNCDSTVFQGSGDAEEACDLGSTKFENGELDGIFESEDEMLNAIRETVESGDHAAERCFDCDYDDD